MSAFNSKRYYPYQNFDLSLVAQDVSEHFKAQEFEVATVSSISGGWQISIHKGGMFKAVLGMKTALNIEIEPSGTGVTANAHVGILGAQVVPSVIMFFVAWPVLLTQIFGLVKQSKLDDEVLDVIGNSLQTRTITKVDAPRSAAMVAPEPGTNTCFCTNCGTQITPEARFCPGCGTKIR